VPGEQELASCKLLSSVDGHPIQGVYITLRMRLLCTIFRCVDVVQGFPYRGWIAMLGCRLRLGMKGLAYCPDLDSTGALRRKTRQGCTCC